MDEQIFRIAPTTAPRATVIFVAPLFEEANRTRRTLALAMRALAAEGLAAVLPDLPAQNESPVPLAEVDLARWRGALAEIAHRVEGPRLVASLRGGCLIDDAAEAAAWWRLAPASGASLLRTLLRARVAADREAGIASSVDGLIETASTEALLLAGNRLSPAMIGDLGAAEVQPVAPLRTVALGSGDDQIAGTPLWLRAEPGEDAAMARAIAADILAWSRSCGVI